MPGSRSMRCARSMSCAASSVRGTGRRTWGQDQGAAACGGRAAGDVLDGGGVEPVAWKVASALDKPDGLTVLDAPPGRLIELDLEDLPGVGGRVRERLWYALHGHDVGPLRTRRGSVGHGRALPAKTQRA